MTAQDQLDELRALLHSAGAVLMDAAPEATVIALVMSFGRHEDGTRLMVPSSLIRDDHPQGAPTIVEMLEDIRDCCASILANEAEGMPYRSDDPRLDTP